MTLQKRFLATLILFAASWSGCDSSDPVVRVVSGMYVGNQGNFTENNGSVSIHDPESGETITDAIPNLDGLVQSVVLDGDRAFILLNFDDSFSTGRGRIDIVDLTTNHRTAQVDVNTPRSAVLDGDVLWVTNLYSDTVTPVDLTANAAGTPIDVGSNPEGLVLAGGRLFVANSGFGFSTTVSVIDVEARSVTSTLDVGCDGPRSLAADADGEVWIFCTGKTVFDADFNILEQTNGAAVVLNASTGSETARIELNAQFGGGALGQDAVFVPVRAEIWAVEGLQLLRFDTGTNSLVETIEPAVPAGRFIGAVGYDAVNDRLLFSTLADFASAGRVILADRTGTEVASFTAGIAPASIAVREGTR